MPEQPIQSDLPLAQLRERAAEYAMMAEYAETPYHREAFGRVAKRYAALVVEREAEQRRDAGSASP